METARVDQWLWAVRIYKTRSLATEACRGGHVKVNGKAAKAATPVGVGTRVEAWAGGRDRDLEVVRVIDKRVGAPVAAECLIDRSPPPPPPSDPFTAAVFERDRGAGRPTKRERRDLDRLRRGH